MARILKPLGAGAASALLLRLSFPVPGLFPLAWVALVPWLLVLGGERRSDAVICSVAMAFPFAALGLSWQFIVTRLGGAGLTVVVALYLCVLSWLLRCAARRLRLPLVIAAPVLWVGIEYLRSFLFTGFPWLFVGHTQRPFLPLIQVCDLFGAYAVSFVVVAFNGAAADLLGSLLRQRFSLPRAAWKAGLAIALLASALAYGARSLATIPEAEGPRVGIVQANIPQEVKNIQTLETIARIFRKHRQLTLRLLERAAGTRLDLIVWPETMVQLPLNRLDLEIVQRFRQELEALANRANCPLLIGAYTQFGRDLVVEAEADGVVRRISDAEIVVDQTTYLLPPNERPDDGQPPTRRILVAEGQRVTRGQRLAEFSSVVHNSAFLVFPREGFRPGLRYDKNHLVPFGEYVPLKEYLGFLGKVVPFPKGFSPGSELKVMKINGWRLGVLICYEDAFPELVRGYLVQPTPADFLVNISNDGWFKGSHQLDQHLDICTFRAVEFRVGIVRSVNSGISAIISPTGRLRALVRDERGRRKLLEGTAIGRVPVATGLTFYARHGDILALACLVACALVALCAIALLLARKAKPSHTTASPAATNGAPAN